MPQVNNLSWMILFFLNLLSFFFLLILINFIKFDSLSFKFNFSNNLLKFSFFI